jgi:hypothetical protein
VKVWKWLPSICLPPGAGMELRPHICFKEVSKWMEPVALSRFFSEDAGGSKDRAR